MICNLNLNDQKMSDNKEDSLLNTILVHTKEDIKSTYQNLTLSPIKKTIHDSFMNSKSFLKNDENKKLKPDVLLSYKTFLTIFFWYFFSFVAIFLSKFLVDSKPVDLLIFSGIQLALTSLCSYINRKYINKSTEVQLIISNKELLVSLSFIGLMRLLVIFLGLVSMKFVALSFMETVKSCSPLFTLIISFFILHEKYGFLVQVSLIPIVTGLLLCSIFEISFNWLGFLAALFSNVAECVQFVLSKIYLGSSKNNLNPKDFQFYSSLYSLFFIIPLWPLLSDVHSSDWPDRISLMIMMVVGVSYYLQTLMAWYLMQHISSVTHSICNTLKCGLAVWLSVPVFGNHVTPASGFGSFLVIIGVCLYQKAKSLELSSTLIKNKEIKSPILFSQNNEKSITEENNIKNNCKSISNRSYVHHQKVESLNTNFFNNKSLRTKSSNPSLLHEGNEINKSTNSNYELFEYENENNKIKENNDKYTIENNVSSNIMPDNHKGTYKYENYNYDENNKNENENNEIIDMDKKIETNHNNINFVNLKRVDSEYQFIQNFNP